MGIPHIIKPGPKKATLKATLIRGVRLQRYCGRHAPYYIRRERGEKGDARKQCRVWKQKGRNVRVQTGCATCKVGLCLKNNIDDEVPSRFELYHDENCLDIVD